MSVLQATEELHDDDMRWVVMTAKSKPQDYAASARSMLQAFVQSLVEPNGSVQGHCESRVLESALCLHLLRRQDLYPKVQESITKFLKTHEVSKRRDPLQYYLRDLVIGMGTRCDIGLLENQLSRSDHYTFRRKRILFNVLVAEFGGAEFDPGLKLDDFDGGEGQRHHSWVALAMRSLKVLAAIGLSRPWWITDEDVEVLRRSQATEGIWEKHFLANALAVTALQHFPEFEHEVRRGVDHLVACQNQDGGFPFITGIQMFCTATAGLALAKCGAPSGTLVTMADYLVANQRPNGGWSYAEGVQQTDVDDTSYCLQFLRELDEERYTDALAKGESYLVAIQNEDGGFPTFLRGGPSEVTMTAAALNALTLGRNVPEATVDAGVRYILEHQRADGTFERSWSLSQNNAIFRVLMALQAVHVGSELKSRCNLAVTRSCSYLRRSQNEDGGWGQTLEDPSDPISTAYGLIALSHLNGYVNDVEPMLRGMGYLLSQQSDAGTFVSVPDQAGPRPIPWNVPVLADVFVLLSFAHMSSTFRELLKATGT